MSYKIRLRSELCDRIEGCLKTHIASISPSITFADCISLFESASSITSEQASSYNTRKSFYLEYIQSHNTFSEITNDYGAITFIPNAFFMSNSVLESISLSSCLRIESNAFGNCTTLRNASFPECSYIGQAGFFSCTQLSQISFPVCKKIDSQVFYNCSSLTSAYFPSCEYIGRGAFSSCVALSQVTFPACSYIGEYVFSKCSSLQTVSLSICEKIEVGAFSDCVLLSSVYLGSFGDMSVCEINDDAFTSTKIQYKAANPSGFIYVPSDMYTRYMKAYSKTFNIKSYTI